MSIGEFIGEVLLRGILEIIFHTLAYYTGAIALWVVTLGQIRLAPLTTIGDKNRSKQKRHQIDWSIWLQRPMQGRALKAECTCLVGIVVWVAIGFGIYFGTRDDKQNADKASLSTPGPLLVQTVMTVQPSTYCRSLALGSRCHPSMLGKRSTPDSKITI